MTVKLYLDVDAALYKIGRVVDSTDPKVKSKIATAINYATRDLRKETRSILKNEMGFPSKRMRENQFSTKRASAANLESTLYVEGSPIPIVEFGGLNESSSGLHVKYTEKAITAGTGSFFQRTDWHKIQRDYNRRYANGESVPTKNGRPLDFLNKKNADRVTIMETSRDDVKSAGSSSAFNGVLPYRAETDEVYGVSVATGIMLPKFEAKYDVYDNQVIQKKFEDKLMELLA
jgi:hypothetical protein